MGSQGSMNVPVWNLIGFQQRERQDTQKLSKDSFCRLPVTSAQIITGREKKLEARVFLNYDKNDHTHGFSHFKKDFRALTKDDIL